MFIYLKYLQFIVLIVMENYLPQMALVICILMDYCKTASSPVQVSRVWIGNQIPECSVGCDYLSMCKILASDAQVLMVVRPKTHDIKGQNSCISDDKSLPTHSWPLLLTWINLNSSMDKKSHAL